MTQCCGDGAYLLDLSLKEGWWWFAGNFLAREGIPLCMSTDPKPGTTQQTLGVDVTKCLPNPLNCPYQSAWPHKLLTFAVISKKLPLTFLLFFPPYLFYFTCTTESNDNMIIKYISTTTHIWWILLNALAFIRNLTKFDFCKNSHRLKTEHVLQHFSQQLL